MSETITYTLDDVSKPEEVTLDPEGINLLLEEACFINIMQNLDDLLEMLEDQPMEEHGDIMPAELNEALTAAAKMANYVLAPEVPEGHSLATQYRQHLTGLSYKGISIEDMKTIRQQTENLAERLQHLASLIFRNHTRTQDHLRGMAICEILNLQIYPYIKARNDLNTLPDEIVKQQGYKVFLIVESLKTLLHMGYLLLTTPPENKACQIEYRPLPLATSEASDILAMLPHTSEEYYTTQRNDVKNDLDNPELTSFEHLDNPGKLQALLIVIGAPVLPGQLARWAGMSNTLVETILKSPLFVESNGLYTTSETYTLTDLIKKRVDPLSVFETIKDTYRKAESEAIEQIHNVYPEIVQLIMDVFLANKRPVPIEVLNDVVETLNITPPKDQESLQKILAQLGLRPRTFDEIYIDLAFWGHNPSDYLQGTTKCDKGETVVYWGFYPDEEEYVEFKGDAQRGSIAYVKTVFNKVLW
ncbi:MAG: hypothetical protein ACOCXQ_03080 [Patescibacteria group bacterium]